MSIINFCLNMFRASLCPSSGEQRPCYCIWCILVCNKREIVHISRNAFFCGVVCGKPCWKFMCMCECPAIIVQVPMTRIHIDMYSPSFREASISEMIQRQCQINHLASELFFFLILAHPVYKMWIIHEPNSQNHETNCILKIKKRRLYTMFKIFSTYICWINI
jgi:hypothetical protein